ncbi:MAG: hypothetical protein V4550_14355 [Gemmatimonadota bacterium]
MSAAVLEGAALTGLDVSGDPTSEFRAFLDGTQRSEVVSHIGTVPVVLGHTAAVIRERSARRMRTWVAPLVATKIYAPRDLLASVTWNTLADDFGDTLVDSTNANVEGGSHPFALRDAAFQRIQVDRELLERQLAEQWCEREADPVFIDGGISSAPKVAASSCAIGVVKTHRTLYAEGEALGVVLSLANRQRSSVFRVTSPKRSTVASWYLRLRDPSDRDPMWGLVRVEVAHPSAAGAAEIGRRADEVSRWILAEVSPLALPDSRWDRLTYGVWDCEQYLRAVAG